MFCLFTAPITKFLEFNFSLNFFSVFSTPVIYPFTFGTRKFYEIIL